MGSWTPCFWDPDLPVGERPQEVAPEVLPIPHCCLGRQWHRWRCLGLACQSWQWRTPLGCARGCDEADAEEVPRAHTRCRGIDRRRWRWLGGESCPGPLLFLLVHGRLALAHLPPDLAGHALQLRGQALQVCGRSHRGAAVRRARMAVQTERHQPVQAAPSARHRRQRLRGPESHPPLLRRRPAAAFRCCRRRRSRGPAAAAPAGGGRARRRAAAGAHRRRDPRARSDTRRLGP
mmetsp:Transcript_37553/g.104438  ORF Transcript_37553/g.104438 Transcript_37553/m.104438 type:complete len:234 (+) Transcript_37553:670-1371(+)